MIEKRLLQLHNDISVFYSVVVFEEWMVLNRQVLHGQDVELGDRFRKLLLPVIRLCGTDNATDKTTLHRDITERCDVRVRSYVLPYGFL